jgi:hypothetical protein
MYSPLGVVRRKLLTFASDPVGSIRSKSEPTLYSCQNLVRGTYRRWGRCRLAIAGAGKPLSTFMSSRPVHAIAPDFADLWFLFHSIVARKPDLILEFGCGCSTVVMAQALKTNGGGFLYSVDADPYWASLARDAMPSYLSSFCEISYSPLEIVERNGVLGYKHLKLPAIAPNFVYLDGPALTKEVQIAIDILDMEEKLPSDFCMVIDGRWENAQYLRRHLKREYSFKDRKFLFNSVFSLIH